MAKNQRRILVPTAACLLNEVVCTRHLDPLVRFRLVHAKCQTALEARNEDTTLLVSYATVLGSFLTHPKREDLDTFACMLMWYARTWSLDNPDFRSDKLRVVRDLCDFFHNALVVTYCNTVATELEEYRARFAELSGIRMPDYGKHLRLPAEDLAIDVPRHAVQLRGYLFELLPLLFPVPWELHAVEKKLEKKRYHSGRRVAFRTKKRWVPIHARTQEVANKGPFKYTDPSC